MRTDSYKLGEFFSGPGGIAKGAHDAANELTRSGLRVDLSHAWAVDIDQDSCATYRRNIPGADEASVLNESVVDTMEKLDSLGEIDGFAFGFPCNDFSLVGERKGLLGDFGPLYKSGVAVLNEKQPDWFVAENVGGIRSANEGKAFDLILDELADAGPGYTVTPHLYRFEEYGVPQRRHRVIVVGIKKPAEGGSAPIFRPPAPTHGPGREPFSTAGEVLSRPMSATVANNERTRQSETVQRRLALIGPGENAFNAVKMTDELRLNVRGATISQIYRRLRFDEPSYTVTGSGGGGTHMYHWSENRALTNRERARLQTFRDDFVFEGGRSSVRKQIGMAVPPDGAKAVFSALFKALAGEPYESVDPNLEGRA